MAGVTLGRARADHRRQGLLGRLMRGHLEAIHARGAEAVAALWASEGTIYGRYGYAGGARCADLTVRSPEARLDAGRCPRPRIALADRRPTALAAIHDAVRPAWPGMLGRRPTEWSHRLHDLEHERAGRSRLQAALLDDGYAVYAVRKAQTDDGLPDSVVELRELIARTPEARAALWAFLLGLELTRRVVWEEAPVDEPIVHRLMIRARRASSCSTRSGSGSSTSAARWPRGRTGRPSTSCSRSPTTSARATRAACG